MLFNYLLSIVLTLVIAALIYHYVGSRFKKGTSSALLMVFILGFGSILLNVFSFYITSLSGLFPLGNSIRRVAFYSLITAGFTREFGKFLVLRFAAMKSSDFNNPADGIVYAVMATLGFTLAAMLWNIIFPVEGIAEYYRSLLTLPANIITAIVLGFFLGLGQLRKNIIIDSMTGIIAASLFHAVIEFSLLTQDIGLIAVAFAGSIVIVAVLISKAISLSAKS